MLTILRGVALALALVLPTTAFAEPPSEGSAVLITSPVVYCETAEQADALAAQFVANDLSGDTPEGCGVGQPTGPVLVGASHLAGLAMEAFEQPRMVWVIELFVGGEPYYWTWAESLASESSFSI